MFGLLGGFPVFESLEQTKRREAYEKEVRERRLAACVPWDPKMPWVKELNLKAETYKVLNLFPEVKPTKHEEINCVKNADEKAVSPTGKYVYCVKTLPRGTKLNVYQGSKRGSVMFDGPVDIPALHEKGWDTRYKEEPWMSFTPMEIMSLRIGARLARGHTVVAGLGLGHQLIEVSRKKTVKKVTLVEISQELVDWILPRVIPHLGHAELETIVGGAKEIVPTLTAAVALIDIFKDYGGNTFTQRCPYIKKVWCWGAANVS